VVVRSHDGCTHANQQKLVLWQGTEAIGRIGAVQAEVVVQTRTSHQNCIPLGRGQGAARSTDGTPSKKSQEQL